MQRDDNAFGPRHAAPFDHRGSFVHRGSRQRAPTPLRMGRRERPLHEVIPSSKGSTAARASPPAAPAVRLGSVAARGAGRASVGPAAQPQSLGRARVMTRPRPRHPQPVARPWLRGRRACAPSSAAPRAPRSSTTRNDTRNNICTAPRTPPACRTTAGRSVSSRAPRCPLACLFRLPQSVFLPFLKYPASNVPGPSASSPRPSILCPPI